MRWVAAVMVALMIVGGVYLAWTFIQNHSTIPKRLLAQYMPFRIDTDALYVDHYDSSFIASIDGGIESRFWRIVLAGEDRKRVAAYCEKRPLWSPQAGATDDILQNHSNYLGARFAPCELLVDRSGDHGYQTFITFDGSYLTLEREAWP